MSDLAFSSATDLAGKIRRKEISAAELLELYLQRVDEFNPDINAVVVDIRDQARQRAREIDTALAKGEDLGPLAGVPMTIKESYNLTGTPTTYGNPEWRDNIATEDAESVKRLKRIGLNVFGKTNVPLSLADFQSYNEIYGTTNNPYDLGRTPGGSSGGSAAALAAGLTGMETGSDIGGSIRNPAHFCGIFGHKPTFNLLWLRGHAPPGDIRSPGDISVIGPMGRSALDLETTLRVMAGPDEIMQRGYQLHLPEWRGRSLRGLRVAVWKNDATAPVAKEVEARVDLVATALKEAGAIIDEDARPAFDPQASHATYQNLLHATMSARMPDAPYDSLKTYVDNLDPDDDSQKARVMRAQVANFKQWSSANEERHKLRWQWHEFFQNYDILLTPMMATAAFEHDHGKFSKRTILVDNQEHPYFEQVFWAGLTGVAYLPSTVIPTGLNDAGLPIGVQIVGQEYDDLITIGVAAELETMGFTFTPPPRYS
jgi:amidase